LLLRSCVASFTVESVKMTGGGFSVSAPGVEFEAKITPIVIISCIMAATGGLMFGYDVGISGNLPRVHV
jgi:hypothetical protein